jgi:hypothetical protein
VKSVLDLAQTSKRRQGRSLGFSNAERMCLSEVNDRGIIYVSNTGQAITPDMAGASVLP